MENARSNVLADGGGTYGTAFDESIEEGLEQGEWRSVKIDRKKPQEKFLNSPFLLQGDKRGIKLFHQRTACERDSKANAFA